MRITNTLLLTLFSMMILTGIYNETPAYADSTYTCTDAQCQLPYYVGMVMGDKRYADVLASIQQNLPANAYLVITSTSIQQVNGTILVYFDVQQNTRFANPHPAVIGEIIGKIILPPGPGAEVQAVYFPASRPRQSPGGFLDRKSMKSKPLTQETSVRDFIRHSFQELQERVPTLTLESFADRLGIGRSSLKMIVSGQRKATAHQILCLGRALRLSAPEIHYLQLLSMSEGAENSWEKAYYAGLLKKLRSALKTKSKITADGALLENPASQPILVLLMDSRKPLND